MPNEIIEQRLEEIGVIMGLTEGTFNDERQCPHLRRKTITENYLMLMGFIETTLLNLRELPDTEEKQFYILNLQGRLVICIDIAQRVATYFHGIERYRRFIETCERYYQETSELHEEYNRQFAAFDNQAELSLPEKLWEHVQKHPRRYSVILLAVLGLVVAVAVPVIIAAPIMIHFAGATAAVAIPAGVYMALPPAVGMSGLAIGASAVASGVAAGAATVSTSAVAIAAAKSTNSLDAKSSSSCEEKNILFCDGLQAGFAAQDTELTDSFKYESASLKKSISLLQSHQELYRTSDNNELQEGMKNEILRLENKLQQFDPSYIVKEIKALNTTIKRLERSKLLHAANPILSQEITEDIINNKKILGDLLQKQNDNLLISKQPQQGTPQINPAKTRETIFYCHLQKETSTAVLQRLYESASNLSDSHLPGMEAQSPAFR